MPSRLIMHISYLIGNILYLIPSRRKSIVQDNINKCFPNYSDSEKLYTIKNCIKEVCRSILERGTAWFGSQNQLKNLVQIHGLEHIPKDGAILLGIHMSGLETCAIALTLAFEPDKWASIYMPQKNQIFDAIVKTQRGRFGTILLSKANSAKNVLRHLKNDGYVQIFADMDFGIKDSIFSNFFGNPAATITSVARISELSNKKVVPMVPIFNRNSAKYDLYILPCFENYPSGNLQNDIDRLNQHFEDSIKLDPSQYWWVHRRFKTKA
jgi:KDO2-lipid IV(A) lauroyltransferase